MDARVRSRRPAVPESVERAVDWWRSLPMRPPTWGEVGICLVGLLALAALVYGSHVAHGDFYSDDWANDSVYRYADSPQLRHAFDTFWSNLGGRPLLALFLAIPHGVFGNDPAAHLALALVLAVLACAAFYMLLRELGLPKLHAGAVAALALLFPWTDSTRLWPTAGINNIAVLLYLLGTIVALRGLRRRPKLVTAQQAAAVLLVVLSVLTYEAAAAAALLSVVLYLRVAPPALAVRRWLVDVAFVGAVLIWSVVRTQDVRGVGGVRTSAGHVPEYTRDAISILGLSFRPFGVPLWVLLVAVAAIVAAGVALARRRPVPGAATDRARNWSLIAVGAAVAVALGYTSFIGYELWPGRGGIYNRGNLLAALPFALLVYSLAMVAGAVAFATSGRWRVLSIGFSLLVVVVVGAGYLDRVLDDKSKWDRAASMERAAIRTLKASVPSLPPGSTVYTFDYPAQVSRGIPIFSDTWDLRGAVRLNWNDKSLAAYPIFEGAGFVCGRDRMFPVGGEEFYFLEEGYGPDQGGTYGKVFLVDLRTRETRRVGDQRACKALIPSMRPGPSYLEG